jgi:15-cis-phytoene synthase / lycopene beta-cyclase
VAFTATLPWDSRLIRSGVWTYPEDSVLGPTLLSIPIEELFFFVIQTYITALLYIMLSKPLLLAQYLNTPKTRPAWIRRGTVAGQVFLAALTALGGRWLLAGGAGTYAGYILFWACPFLLLTWSISGDLLLAMPWPATVLPILLPTFFLWHVDNIYLGRGTWAIESGTKFNRQLFGSLEVEEALFFLITNTLIVFGVAAFDHAVAVCELHPELFVESADSLPIVSLLRARILPSSRYDEQRILGLREAVTRLKRKSRSFFLASFVFPGRVRIDLTLLYVSFL